MPSSEDALNRMIDASAETNAQVLADLDAAWHTPEGASLFDDSERRAQEAWLPPSLITPDPKPIGQPGSPARRAQDLENARRSYTEADALLRRRLART